MGKRNLLLAFAAIGLFIMTADARPGEPPDSSEVFIEVRPDEQPVPADGRYHETFAVRIDMEAMQQPAQRRG